jgi:gliding motility-associated-like protein
MPIVLSFFQTLLTSKLFKKSHGILIISVFAFTFSFAQPVANFTADRTSGCSPQTINFTNLSTGGTAPLTYNWDFGNGVTSTFQNAATTYFVNGAFTVRLTVTDANGLSNTVTRTNYINIQGSPQVDFAADDTIGCFKHRVNFTNFSLPGSGTIQSFLWDFGNGTQNSTDLNPTTVYNLAALNIPVSLTVVNSNGCSSTFTKSNYIDVTPGVIANFFAPSPSGCRPPISIPLQNTSSGPGTLTYNWDFGNSTTSNAFNPTAVYNTTGNYRITLSVTSDQGCFDSISRPLIIPNTTVQSSFSAPDTVCLGQNVNFINTSTPVPDSSFWTFGDGTSSTIRNPVKVYNSSGLFNVKMVNKFGICIDSFSKPIFVLPTAPVNLTSTNNIGCRAQAVDFTATSPGGISWSWDFGDGSPAVTTTTPNVRYVYPALGSYTVTVTVTNNQRCPSRVSIPNFVQLVAPIITLRNIPDSGCLPFTITPDVTVNTIDGIQSWLWNYGDGTTSTSPIPPPHTYTSPGSFRFQLRVITNGGCIESIDVPNAITVGNLPPVGADFTGAPLNTCAGTPVNFANLTPPSIFISGWLWNFGDGFTSTNRSPIYTYQDTGRFDVSLKVFSNGCGTTVSKPGFVNIFGAVARFNYTVDCADKRTVNFRDSSINATSVVWNFGDGSPTSTLLNPVHTYAALGNYPVTLTATNGACSFTLLRMVEIVDERADFIINPNPLCKGVSANFTATGSIDTNVIRYDWDFGDGNFNQFSRSVITSFPISGLNNTRLRITDVNGCLDSITKVLPVGGPKAGLGAINPEGCRGITVNFIDSSRTDGVNAIIQRIWDFGDGTVQTINAPPYQHTYNIGGTFNVKLKIIDAGGCTDSIIFNNFVTASEPKAKFRTDSTQSCPGARVQFINETDLSINNFTWSFGDGNGSSAGSPFNIYTAPGTYTVKLKVRDAFGCEDSLTRADYVFIDNPYADFSLSDSIAYCPPLNVNMRFTGRYQQSVRWDFGDGAVSDTLYPSKLYNMPGNYRVLLTVTSPGGCRDTLSKPIIIYGPTANFDYSPLAGCDSVTVNFRAFNSNNVDSIQWDFGDGKVITKDSTITYTYTTPGNYRPSIILQDITGCKVAVQGADSIKVVAIHPGFISNTQLICDRGPIQFTDTTLIISSARKTSWLWNFGDGTTSTQQNPLHNYTTTGLYNVTLTVGTEFGCTESVTRTGFIRVVQSPITDIAASALAICQEGSITFQGIETVPDTSVLQWSWDFANGQQSQLQNPIPQFYRTPGSFTVRLVTTNSSGCTDTTSQIITINPLPAVVASPDSTICLGQSVQLNATGTNTYLWLPPANNLSCTACPNPIATPAVTTTYLVRGTTAFGCERIDSLRITVIQPSTVVAPPDDSLCLGESLVLRATGTQVFSWTPVTSLNNPNIPNPIANPSTTTTYTVTGSDFKGCFITTDTVLVTVFPLPTVNVGPDITISAGTADLQLNSQYSNDVLALLWSPSTGLSCTTCSQPIAAPKITTTYTLRVTNNGGCTATDAMTVFVVCTNDNIFMPNTFSPNGDGMNDIYYPRGRGINTIRGLRIFNRWGQMVYSNSNFNANDPSKGWDGRFRGTALPPDVYVYTLDLVCENQTIITLKGDITLVR